jgi:hypothetical protein
MKIHRPKKNFCNYKSIIILQADSFADVKVGDLILNATVTYFTSNGLTISLRDGVTGFIPNKKVK